MTLKKNTLRTLESSNFHQTSSIFTCLYQKESMTLLKEENHRPFFKNTMSSNYTVTRRLENMEKKCADERLR